LLERAQHRVVGAGQVEFGDLGRPMMERSRWWVVFDPLEVAAIFA
jgi:hypothetical protein